MNAPAPRMDALINVDCEAALLGALMIDNNFIDMAADRLSVEDFGDPLMGRIYSVIVSERMKGRPANPVTLRPFFADDALMAQVGGAGYLGLLTSSSVAVIGTRDFIDQIASLSSRRRLIEGLHEAIALAANPDSSTEQLIDAADAALFDATHKGDPIHQPSAAQCLDEVLAQFSEPQVGVECKVVPSIDNLLGGLRPKSLTIGAGRPGMGKTAVALSYALGAAQNGHGVLFVSLEMSSTELGARMAADMCFTGRGGVPYATIRSGNVTEEQRREVYRARTMLEEMPFRVVDASSLTIGRLAMMVRRHKRRMAAQGVPLELVVVDYLQLLHPDTKARSNYEAVSEVSRGLKAIAKENEVAVFALAQLSREAEKRPDKRPQLSDLRDSGQIEQDADSVLLLYRNEYYLRQNEPDENDPSYFDWKAALADAQNRIEFIAAKVRHGMPGARVAEFWASNQAVRG
jgi:replicative DNA helicase